MGDRTDMNQEDVEEVTYHQGHTVQLIPYRHQVGGHVGIFEYDKDTICKPLNEQEWKAYNCFPKELKEFVPQYCGMLKVYFEKCGEDILCFALPSDRSNYEDEKGLPCYVDSAKEMSREKKNKSRKEHGNNPFQNQEKLYKKSIKKYTKLETFIKLECISKHYKFPCTIDLKMGTRGYSDFASKEKRELKEERINNSTSRTLGVRVCGMQVYSMLSEKYTFTDKYEGRRFTEEEFKNCLQGFLYNNVRYRTELIGQFIQRLQTLRDHLQKIEGFRFYCSSLLLVYDGYKVDQAEETSTYPDVEVRMIDFANARLKEEESNHNVGPDHGYIFGVTSLINIFTEIQQTLCGHTQISSLKN